MKYLLEETCASICKLEPNGNALWQKHKSSLTLVIARPNGWESDQENILSDAAYAAANALHCSCEISFVKEADASLYFCIRHPSEIITVRFSLMC